MKLLIQPEEVVQAALDQVNPVFLFEDILREYSRIIEQPTLTPEDFQMLFMGYALLQPKQQSDVSMR